MSKTFLVLKPHFDALARAGYFRIVLNTVTPTKRRIHDAFRVMVWFIVILYNLQHLLRVIQTRHSTDKMVDTLFILLTTLNCLGKQVAFNVRASRIDHIISIIDGDLFAAKNPHHEELIKHNAVSMYRLLKLYHGAIFTCGILWTVFPLVNRALGEEVEFTGYFPFSTQKSPIFELVLAYMSILIIVQAYGNVTMDCTIVGFNALAGNQLQILKYNLEHLADSEHETGMKTIATKKISYNYKDVEDQEFKKKLQHRLVVCVNHYGQIVWLVKEVEAIFGEAMMVQFFVMAWVICMTVYKIVGLSIFSAEFVSMAVYLGCMLAQLFIYCYYGTQLRVESELVNQSAYSAEWISLSPAFRRQLLLFMECCLRPILPRIAYIIPMSMETYISVLKSSYTLFTFLNR